MPFSHSIRLAMKVSELAVDSHTFVYWPEEGTVSVLAKRKIMEGEAKPGRECKVRVGKTIHPAVIVRTGTRKDMVAAEELFIKRLLEVPELPHVTTTPASLHMPPVLPHVTTPASSHMPPVLPHVTTPASSPIATTPNATMLSQQSGQNPLLPVTLPPLIGRATTLPSSAIQKDSLSSVPEVLSKYSHLRTDKKMGKFAVKLGKEAIFGESVMQQCTPRGAHNLPALPQQELYFLKTTLFGQFTRFWGARDEFEKKWYSIQEALAQACKRLRTLSGDQ